MSSNQTRITPPTTEETAQPRRPETSASMNQMQRLIQLIEHSNTAGLEIKDTRLHARLLLRKIPSQASASLQPPQHSENARAPQQHPDMLTIHAPFTGCFSLWHTAPESCPLTIGAVVPSGQGIGMIQVLDRYSEIEMPCAGVISEILVQDG